MIQVYSTTYSQRNGEMRTKNVNNIVDIQHDKSGQDLIDVARSEQPGRLNAISILLKRYQNELFKRCYYRLGNMQDAEDALQETLFRAYRAIHRFEGKSSFRTWLYSITDNQCNTLANKRKRCMLSEHTRALIEIHEWSTRQREDFEDTAQVNLTLDMMTEKTKQILRMRYYMELSLEEIAHNLGVGLSAAKMRLYRAQDTFRQHHHDSMVTS